MSNLSPVHSEFKKTEWSRVDARLIGMNLDHCLK
jgi:hypothetical protein